MTDTPDDNAAAGGDPPAGPAASPSSTVTVAGQRTGMRGRIDLRLALTIAVGLVVGQLLAGLAGGIIFALRGLIILVVVSLFLSFAMEPAVQWMAERGIRRGMGTGIVFVIFLLGIAGFIAAIAPLVVDQIQNLVDAGPDVLSGLAERARSLPESLAEPVVNALENAQEELPSRLPSLAGAIGRQAASVGQTVLGGVFQVLTISLVTFYLVADGPKLRRTLSSRLPPQRQHEFLETWELAIAKTGGYVYSRALLAVISAVFHIVAFSFIGLEYSAALGVWVGLLSSLIPVVGTYLAGALPLIIALADDPVLALWVLAAIGIYQQVENYLVAPKVTAHALELHPAVAFLAVLVGAALLGPVGALLALPVAAIIAALVTAYAEEHDVAEHRLTTTADAQVATRRRRRRSAGGSSDST